MALKWRPTQSDTFAEAYRRIIDRIRRANPDEACTTPRGLTAKEILYDGFEIPLQDNGLFVNEVRSTDLRYLAGELLWYFGGRNDLEFIKKYSTFWEKIANPDGTCNSAYGRLLFQPRATLLAPDNTYHTPYSEWQWMLTRLLHDNDTRQATAVLHRPEHHWTTNKDIVCTMSLGFIIRNSQLHLWTHMRSSDVWYGLPFDAPFFLLLGKQMQMHLAKYGTSVKLGKWTHTAVSTHMYERDQRKIRRMMRHAFTPGWMPKLDVSLIHPSGGPTPALTAATEKHVTTAGEFLSWLSGHAHKPKEHATMASAAREYVRVQEV